MPRPQQNNADYFSHDNNMRNHRKVKILRNKFGPVLGYAFWSMLLEILTEMDGTEIEYAELEFEMLASELGVSAAEIKNMVDLCLKLEMIFLTNDSFVYSESLNIRLSPVFEKRRREREKSKTRLRRLDGQFVDPQNDKTPKSTTGSGVSAAEMRQSKVNKSKVNIIVPKGTIVGLPVATPTDGETAIKKPTFEDRCRNFILKFNEIRSSKFQVTETVRTKLKARLKDYTSKQIIDALKNAMLDEYHKENNYKHITPEFMLRADKIEKFLNQVPPPPAPSDNVRTINHDHLD